MSLKGLDIQIQHLTPEERERILRLAASLNAGYIRMARASSLAVVTLALIAIAYVFFFVK